MSWLRFFEFEFERICSPKDEREYEQATGPMVAHSKENEIHEKNYMYTTEKTHQLQVYVQCTTHNSTTELTNKISLVKFKANAS